MAGTREGKRENYLVGKLLLAMPAMGDPRFEKAVIFICAHDENGAMGLVVNHVLPDLEFRHLIDQIGIVSDIQFDPQSVSVPVMSGGPVESARGFLLHSSDFTQPGTVRIDESFSVTGTIEALKKIAGGLGPARVLFLLGYAGWGAGQLEKEMQQNAWLVVDPDPAIVFHQDAARKWALAVGKLGFDPGMLSGEAGRA